MSVETSGEKETTVTTKQPTFKPALRLIFRNFFEHNVGKNAAGLAYYLLFALFPLLIFISNLLGLLNLDVNAITQTLRQVLPKDIVEIIGSYLDYVSHTSSQALMWFALVFSVWFPMRAAKGLMDDVRLAYNLKKPKHPVTYTIRQLVYTIVLLIVVALTLLFSTLGEQVVNFLIELVPNERLQISDYLLTLWQYLRFLLIGVLMFAALGTLYAAALDERQPIKMILPGITVALFSWMAVSVGFSFYVDNFANYSLIYGTLGAVIVLLMWLYITAAVLIIGAEVNAALLTIRGGGSNHSER